jgi:hypothetical protein
MVKMHKYDIFVALNALEFYLDSMTDDGGYSKAMEMGYELEVKLINKLRNGI